jgi:hypothetical protein
MPHNTHPVVPTVHAAQFPRNTSVVDVTQDLLRESSGGDSLPDVAPPHIPHSEARLPEVHQDDSGGEESTSHCIEEEAIVVVLWFGSGSCHVRFLCPNLFISGIDYDTPYEVIGLLRVRFVYGFFIGFILFIVLRDITHAAFYNSWHVNNLLGKVLRLNKPGTFVVSIIR